MKNILDKINAALLGAVLALAPLTASAQTIGPSQYAQQSVVFNTGTTSWVVPPNVTYALGHGCAPGGAGGSGQAVASTAGGGGGGGGTCIRSQQVPLTPGATITITIPTPPAAPAVGAGGLSAGNLTVAGLPWGTITLNGGCGGSPGATAVGGAGGSGGGQCQSLGIGQPGGAAATSGGNANPSNDPFWSGLGGGGGGNTASGAGSSGQYANTTVLGNLFGLMKGLAGTGNGAGGGGAGTIFGQGQSGTAAGVGCSASPVFVGYGVGGCGGGSNAAGGPGGPGFFMFTF